MAAENWFGESMTLTVDTEDSSPVSVPVGSLKQVQMIARADHVELESADTILREDVAKRNLRIDVTAGVAAFDNTIMEEWFGGDGTASSSPTDDNTVATFEMVGSMTSPGGTTHTVTATGVYFPAMPLLDTQEGQWVQHNLEGSGKTATIS